MPISVTCDCGARLEIDEKFLGKEIPCPDCGKPLPTKAPPKPPPLDLPDNRRLSALAVASLAVGLVGVYTIIGSLAGIALGIFAIRSIQKSKKLDGLNFAWAGVAVGGVGLFFTLVLAITPFGLDGFLREFAFLGRISYGVGASIESRSGDILIKRPVSASRWATLESQTPNVREVDDLIAVNVSADAYMGCQHVARGINEDEETIQKAVKERVERSELVNMIGRLSGQPVEGKNVTHKKIDKDGIGETTMDIRLGGHDRRFLILYRTKNRLRFEIFVGCARTNRFDSMQDEFRDAFSGFTSK